MVDPTWVALSLSRHIGGKTLKNLLDYFQHDLNAILSADEKSLRKVNGIGAKIAQTIRELDVDATAEAMHRWGDAGVQICTWDDPAYPAILKTLDDPRQRFLCVALMKWIGQMPSPLSAHGNQPNKHVISP